MKEVESGKVYLVGAGPGDPGLLTLKGLECLKKAKVVVCDYLVNEELLNWIKEDTEIIYAGKKAGKHTLSQEEINHLLANKAKEGKIVVRLKGGDPFVFGRGGEEAEFLANNNVEFEVVPGVTSAVAVPAYAGIPLTHRKYTSTATIITGHEDVTKDKSSFPWQEIAKMKGTIVVLMGTSNLTQIIKNLVKYGCSDQTPIAVIQWGTLNKQKTIIGTLNDIVEKTRKITPPTTIVIGEIVNLRETLNWFEKKPLFGKRILVTRAREQASKLSELLKSYGAEVIEFPVIKIVPPSNFKPLDDAINQIDTYNWIIFTSSNGVRYFFNRLREKGKDIREISKVKIAVIGSETKKILENLYLNVDFCPEKEFTQEGLIEGFKKLKIKGEKVLIPRSNQARKVLIEELKKMGAKVDEIIAYRTIKEKANISHLKKLLLQGKIDIITFTSSSTVTNFCSAFNKKELNTLLNKVKIASIGPITTQKIQSFDLNVDIIAKEYTINGLVEAILEKAKIF